MKSKSIKKKKEKSEPSESSKLEFSAKSVKKKIVSITSSRKAQIIAIILILTGASIFLYFYIFKDLPNPWGLKDYKVIPISTQILDRRGELLFEIFRDENRTPVKLKSLPKDVVRATIAIEDADFYNHHGISLFGGIIRAIKDTFILQKGLQGGSTITQQLVKSTFLTPDRTIQRKLKEIVLALWVEQIFDKDEILELYLNQVPFGGVSYGIQEAARTFFGKNARELELHEAALLAGLPRAPTAYSPFTNFKKAVRRQREVLKRMRELKYISKSQYEKAKSKKLEIQPPKDKIKAPHFVFYVKSMLEKEYGLKMVEEGGLKVYTTVDADIQASAEAILREEVEDIKRLKVTNGAALVTRPSTGEILAMIGSTDFFATPSGSFNVSIAHRQPGSSIKPINYAIGIDRGIVTPATVFLDIPTCFSAPGQPKSYCPVNYDGAYHGLVQLRFALGNSYNLPAVKMLALNTVEDFVASSGAFLIKSFKDPKKYGLSLTLGGGEVTMVEMAQAFSTFANEGVPKKLVSILKVEDKGGKVLFKYKDPNFVKDVQKPIGYPNFLSIPGDRAISKETAFLISHILLDNNARSAAFGSGGYLVVSGKAVSVKTGTTNDFRDNWTIGYTPNFLTVVWVGNNDNSPMSRVVSGITGAAPIWNRIMRKVLKDQDDLWPRKPSGIVGNKVCVAPIQSSSEGDNGEPTITCNERFEYFIKGTSGRTGIYTAREFVHVNKDTGYMTKADDPQAELQEKTIVVDLLGTKYCLDCNHEGEPHTTVKLFSREGD